MPQTAVIAATWGTYSYLLSAIPDLQDRTRRFAKSGGPSTVKHVKVSKLLGPWASPAHQRTALRYLLAFLRGAALYSSL